METIPSHLSPAWLTQLVKGSWNPAIASRLTCASVLLSARHKGLANIERVKIMSEQTVTVADDTAPEPQEGVTETVDHDSAVEDETGTPEPETAVQRRFDFSVVGPVQQNILEDLAEKTREANEIALKVASVTVEAGKAVHELRQNSDHPEIVEYRKWLEKVSAKIEEETKRIDTLIRENLLPTKTGEVDVEAETKLYKALKDDMNATRNYLKTRPNFPQDLLTDERFDLKSLRGTKTSGSVSGVTGEGPKRPRLAMIWVDGERTFATVDNKDGTKREAATFTHTASVLSRKSGTKVTAPDLQAAAFETAKTDDLSTKAGEIIEFYYSAGDKNFKIQVQPRDNASAE
jgi:hypothetical protein